MSKYFLNRHVISREKTRKRGIWWREISHEKIRREKREIDRSKKWAFSEKCRKKNCKKLEKNAKFDIWKKLMHKNAIKIVWGVKNYEYFLEGKIVHIFFAILGALR